MIFLKIVQMMEKIILRLLGPLKKLNYGLKSRKIKNKILYKFLYFLMDGWMDEFFVNGCLGSLGG